MIRIEDGHVIRNGRREHDSYIAPCSAQEPNCSYSKAIRIPKGMWFMMGDNRGVSDDSRYWGPVADELADRQRVLHLLAPRPHRHPLNPSAAQAAGTAAPTWE